MAALVTLCDWEVEALARAGLAVGAVVSGEVGGEGGGEAPALAAARAFVDCPCLVHARAVVAAAGAAPDDPAAQAADLAALLTLRAREARHVPELEALVGLLVQAAIAAGAAPEGLLEAARASVVPWALTRARMVGELAEGEAADGSPPGL